MLCTKYVQHNINDDIYKIRNKHGKYIFVIEGQ